MSALLDIDVPAQILELADTMPASISPLDTRSGLALIRDLNGEQIFKLAEAGVLDKSLTYEQLEQFGLSAAHEKQQTIIDNAVAKVNKYMIDIGEGQNAVIAPEQIFAGASVAYELGCDFYCSVEPHKTGEGSTFAITAKPGVTLPEIIQKFGERLVEKYKRVDGSSGVFLSSQGNMLVAGGPKNPDFSVDMGQEELMDRITQMLTERNLDNLTTKLLDESREIDAEVSAVRAEVHEHTKEAPEQGRNAPTM